MPTEHTTTSMPIPPSRYTMTTTSALVQEARRVGHGRLPAEARLMVLAKLLDELGRRLATSSDELQRLRTGIVNKMRDGVDVRQDEGFARNWQSRTKHIAFSVRCVLAIIDTVVDETPRPSHRSGILGDVPKDTTGGTR